MKRKIIQFVWSMASLCIFAAPLAFPESDPAYSLALAYAWVMMALSLTVIALIFVTNACQYVSDEDLSAKSVSALKRMRDEKSKRGWLAWIGFVVAVALIALSGMTITAICYALVSLFARGMSVVLTNAIRES